MMSQCVCSADHWCTSVRYIPTPLPSRDSIAGAVFKGSEITGAKERVKLDICGGAGGGRGSGWDWIGCLFQPPAARMYKGVNTKILRCSNIKTNKLLSCWRIGIDSTNINHFTGSPFPANGSCCCSPSDLMAGGKCDQKLKETRSKKNVLRVHHICGKKTERKTGEQGRDTEAYNSV